MLKQLALLTERECKDSEDISYIFRELKDVTITLPIKTTGVTDEYNKVIWSKK